MELSEKIQKLRKEHGLTQEQFAQQLFVSRTAVSKWETGRGTPNMESLQMIARFFDISLDELLKAEEVLTIAENENKERINRLVFCVDSIFNIAAMLSVILPLYKTELDNMFYSVPLYQFNGWLSVLYWIFPVAMAVCGVAGLLTSKCEKEKLKKSISIVALVINTSAVFVLILSSQPYPTVLFFVLLFIKAAVMLLKHK